MFVLLRLGLTVQATEDEVVDFCLLIAKGEVENGSQVVRWLAPRLLSVA